MLSSCCQGNGGSHRLFRQVMWPAALTSPWEAVWCSELSCGWVLWSFSLELLVASKLVPDTCSCISSLRPHNASSLPSSPGYGHLKSHSTSPEQPPEVSSVFFFLHVLLFSCRWSLSAGIYALAMHWCTVRGHIIEETAEFFSILWGLDERMQAVAQTWTGCNNLNC